MQYQAVQFESDGRTFDLSDEVFNHLVKIALTEQAEQEKASGVKPAEPRKRPTLKRRSEDA